MTIDASVWRVPPLPSPPSCWAARFGVGGGLARERANRSLIFRAMFVAPAIRRGHAIGSAARSFLQVEPHEAGAIFRDELAPLAVELLQLLDRCVAGLFILVGR